MKLLAFLAILLLWLALDRLLTLPGLLRAHRQTLTTMIFSTE